MLFKMKSMNTSRPESPSLPSDAYDKLKIEINHQLKILDPQLNELSAKDKQVFITKAFESLDMNYLKNHPLLK